MDRSQYKAKGRLGEKIAQEYLAASHYDILCTNYQSKIGEIDIIARDKLTEDIVCMEVKNYNPQNDYHPLEAAVKKKHRVVKTASLFLAENELYNDQIRFDLIIIENNAVKTHLKDIIEV